jgi:hypothetical protein
MLFNNLDGAERFGRVVVQDLNNCARRTPYGFELVFSGVTSETNRGVECIVVTLALNDFGTEPPGEIQGFIRNYLRLERAQIPKNIRIDFLVHSTRRTDD